MSKRSVKMNQTRKSAKSPARPDARATAKKPAGGKPSNGRSRSAQGRAPVKPEALANLQAVRIVSGAAALLFTAGVITALVMQTVGTDLKGILLMLMMGIFIAAGIFTAVNPQMVVGWIGGLGKK